MTLLLRDFVCESCTNPGTSSSITLGGTPSGSTLYKTFDSVLNTGDKTPYVITDDAGKRETGYGTFTAPSTLTRTIVFTNTENNTSRLNFTGACFVYIYPPADRTPLLDEDNNLSLPGNLLVHGDYPGSTNVGRNLYDNSEFFILHRGFGPWVGGGFTADRWYTGAFGGTVTTTINLATDADRAAIGSDLPVHIFQIDTVAGFANNHWSAFGQRLEYVTRAGGKTFTLSFYARATSGTPSVSISFEQAFGSGGSSSVIGISAQKIALSTTWTRYTAQITSPSLAGKTIGSVNTDSFIAWFWTSAGSDYNSQTGSLGLQNSTLQFWGMQLEYGTVATPYEVVNRMAQLIRCQRFYENSLTAKLVPWGWNSAHGWVAQYSFIGIRATVIMQVDKRVTPTITIYDTNLTPNAVTWNNLGTLNYGLAPTWVAVLNNKTFNVGLAATGMWECQFAWEASSEF